MKKEKQMLCQLTAKKLILLKRTLKMEQGSIWKLGMKNKAMKRSEELNHRERGEGETGMKPD